MLITIVAGARPNFIKIAPIIKAIKKANREGCQVKFRIVHTGQHFDKKMSGDFFEQLCIPEPDINLSAGGGSQSEQTAAIMVKFEKELLENRPDVVLVVGDVTSTMACTITAKKLCIDVVHVEAGIRSGDMTMPEEINRIVTDSISDYFFTTSDTATNYLINSGVQEERIFFVGNTMIDSLNQNLDKLRSPSCWEELKLEHKNYFLLTLHRPSNVDDENVLKDILEKLLDSTKDFKVIFPVHPRTYKTLEKVQLKDDRIKYIEPLSYHEFLFLVQNAKAIITDSGGITEEATVLNIPCLTLRNSTERPETVTLGTNELIGNDLTKLGSSLSLIMNNEWKDGKVPPLWDGKASERIVQTLISIYSTEVVTA